MKLDRRVLEFSLSCAVRANPGAVPDFLIVGAQKAGTTALFAALARHPQVLGALRKEIHYFDLRTTTHSLGWYRGHFPPVGLLSKIRGQRMIAGEASPSYLLFPDCAARIAEACPLARILVVLRNPVDRAVSHYYHNRRVAGEAVSTDMEQEIFAEHDRVGALLDRLTQASAAERAKAARFAYLMRGHYAQQIEGYMHHFGRERVLVVTIDELIESMDGVSARICGFLGVDPIPLVFEKRNASGQQSVDAKTRDRLRRYYVPHNAALEHLLDRDMQWD